MKNTFRLLYFSSFIIVIAWISKMHFIYGGDILFRTGTTGVVGALLIQSFLVKGNEEIRASKTFSLFLLNGIFLTVLYTGMMMKASHLMNTQFEKDFVLDFAGLPLVVISIFMNAEKALKVVQFSDLTKILFIKHILAPWAMMLFSFILYALYSAILARQ
jgi:hypothetical protein